MLWVVSAWLHKMVRFLLAFAISYWIMLCASHSVLCLLNNKSTFFRYKPKQNPGCRCSPLFSIQTLRVPKSTHSVGSTFNTSLVSEPSCPTPLPHCVKSSSSPCNRIHVSSLAHLSSILLTAAKENIPSTVLCKISSAMHSNSITQHTNLP